MNPRIEPPGASRIGYLFMHRFALGEQANTLWAAVLFRPAEELFEGGEGTGGEDIGVLRGERLDAGVGDGYGEAGLAGDGSEEGRLALVAFDEVKVEGGGGVGGDGCEDEAREAGA